VIARATISVAGYGVRVGCAGTLQARQTIYSHERGRYVKTWRKLRVGLRFWLLFIECGFEYDAGEWEYDASLEWGGDHVYNRRRNLFTRWSDAWRPF
jgi:hypothetical protein